MPDADDTRILKVCSWWAAEEAIDCTTDHLKRPVEPSRLLCNLSAVAGVLAAQEYYTDRAEYECVPVLLPVPSLPRNIYAVPLPRDKRIRA